MRRLAHLSLLLALGASPLRADLDRSKKPEPDAAPAASFPDFQTFTLSNGLKVFIIEDDRKPTIALRLVIKSGSTFDGEKAGLSAFVAALLNRGTAHRSADAFAQESDYLGVKFDGLSGPDSVAFSAAGLTTHTAQMLDLFADAVLNPTFPAEQFAKEQRKMLSTLESEKQQPAILAAKLAGRVVFGVHPYGAYRTPASVRSITRDDLAAFHQTHFAPNNASLAVVGDVKTAEIVPLLEKALGGWKAHAVPEAKLPAIPELKGITIHLLDRPGSVQSNIVICATGPARNNPDTPELNVVNATLGGGFSGRLFQNLREKHGWTYGAYSAFGLNRFGGNFTANAETRNAVTVPAITETLKEITRLRDEAVPEEELNLQRQYNVGNYLLSLEKSDRTATRVQDIDLYGLPADFYKTYARRMAAVTPVQTQELARKYLNAENLAIVVVGEAKEIKPELEKIGKVVLYDQNLQPVP